MPRRRYGPDLGVPPLRGRPGGSPLQEILEEMDLPPDEPLLGVFQGVSLMERSVTAPPLFPDTIFLFQEPLEEMCESLEELEEQIEITVVHEIAHFFGFSEERLAELGYE
jgi:predicted Zn-dependent protease with MMP-like domain